MAWNNILTVEQIEARYALTMQLDPRFALAERNFWETRNVCQLSCLASGAWEANDADTYQMARSYLHHAGAALNSARGSSRPL